MRTSSHKDNRSTARSLSPLVLSCPSLWNSNEQAKYSSPRSIVPGYVPSPTFSDQMKQSESQFQEQDSSSTLSRCQSHPAMGKTARNNSMVQNPGSQHGTVENCGMDAEHQKKSSLPYGNADYAQVQFDYNQAMAIPYQWAESCVGALVAAYGPNALVYPQMLGINQASVPIPLDCAETIPVYVNPKQFRAILRRRQMRAKLEAQNNIMKSRKPYLHESRHLHALKRPRGLGGRFLNAKTTSKFKPSSLPKQHKEISSQHSDSGGWETSAQSGSDVTSIFSCHDIFQQPEVKLSKSPFHLDTRVGDYLISHP